jgi:hypothetical protein
MNSLRTRRFGGSKAPRESMMSPFPGEVINSARRPAMIAESESLMV